MTVSKPASEFLMLPNLRDGMDQGQREDYWRNLTEMARALPEEGEMDASLALSFWCKWLVERIKHQFDAVVVITGDEGCHDPEQGILRFDGSIVRAKDVKLGDLLMGPDSRPRTVLRLFQGRRNMVRVVPTRGMSPFVVTDNHSLALRVRYHRENRVEKIITMPVCELPSPNARQNHNFMLFGTGVRFPRQRPVPMDPYILGVWLGDGTKSGSFAVTTADAEIRSAIATWAERIGDVVHERPHPRSPSTFNVAVVRPQRKGHPRSAAQDALMRAGANSMRCETAFIPHHFLVASEHERLELLAGLLDTDGYLKDHAAEYFSKSERLVRDVAFLGRSLGFPASIGSSLKRCPTGAVGRYYRVRLMGDLTRVPCRVARKVTMLGGARPSRCATGPRRWKDPWNHQFRIEPLGEGEYVGFTVDRDHLYLTDEFMVTKNTGKSTLALRMAMECARLQKIAWEPTEVCYSAIDLIKAYQTAKRGRPIWYDEGVRGTMAGEQMLPEQRALVKALALVRESGAILFALYPSIWLASKQIRARRACLWIHVVHRGLGRVHERDRRLNYLPTDALGLAISPRAPHVAWKAFDPQSKAWSTYLATKTARLQEFLHETERDLKMRAEPKPTRDGKGAASALGHARVRAPEDPNGSLPALPTEAAVARTRRLGRERSSSEATEAALERRRRLTRMRVAKWRKNHSVVVGVIGVDKPPSVGPSK